MLQPRRRKKMKIKTQSKSIVFKDEKKKNAL